RFVFAKWTLGGTSPFHVAPYQFIRVQFRCIAGVDGCRILFSGVVGLREEILVAPLVRCQRSFFDLSVSGCVRRRWFQDGHGITRLKVPSPSARVVPSVLIGVVLTSNHETLKAPPHRRHPPLATSSIGVLPTPALDARGRILVAGVQGARRYKR